MHRNIQAPAVIIEAERFGNRQSKLALLLDLEMLVNRSVADVVGLFENRGDQRCYLRLMSVENCFHLGRSHSWFQLFQQSIIRMLLVTELLGFLDFEVNQFLQRGLEGSEVIVRTR